MNILARRNLSAPWAALALAALVPLVSASGARAAVQPEPGILYQALRAAAALDEGGMALSVESLFDSPPSEAVWVELTPLGEESRPIVLWQREPERGLDIGGLVRGPALVCAGGGAIGVACRRLFLPVPTAETLVLAPGLPAAGRYLLDDLPVADARIAVVPAALELTQPFTMPLGTAEALAALAPRDGAGDAAALPGRGSRALARAVTSGEDGTFQLPPLAPGRYRLETLLPTGQLHHSEPFDLPALVDARRTLGAFADAPPVWQLGEFDVAAGLTLSVRAHLDEDPDMALAGVAISAVEGTAPAGALLFQGHTDADGEARLSGFSAVQPGYLNCHAEGFRSVTVRWQLVPPQVTCPLERLATLSGQVQAGDGTVPAGAAVRLLAALEPAADPPAEARLLVPELQPEAPLPERPVALDRVGAFRVDVPAAGYRLEASAPGFVTEIVEVALASGSHERLETVVLLPAGEPIEGLVVDARTGDPIAGAEIAALEPAGAVAARSDEDGAFRFLAASDRPLHLRVHHPDYAPAEIALPPQDRGRDDLRVELDQGGRILVVMWDAESGETCRGCPVVLHPGRETYRTDGTGEVTIGPLAPGRYRVERPRVMHLGSVAIEQPEGDVRHVRVRTGGIAPVWFGERRRPVRLAFRPGLDDGWLLSARSGRRIQRRHPEADGDFLIEQDRDEDLMLYLERYEAASGALLEVWAGRLPAGTELEEVTLRLPPTEVRGRARSGDALVGTRIRLLSLIDRTLGARAFTDRDGRFRLPHVRPGIYAFEVGERTVRFVRVEASGTIDLGDLDLPVGCCAPAVPLPGQLSSGSQ